MSDDGLTPSRRQVLQGVAGFGALSAGGLSAATTETGDAVTSSSVLLSDDFEDEPTGTFPSEWTINGNDEQEVTDQSANTGAQSLAMSGVEGGCWEAIAKHPLSLPSEGTVVFSGAYYPTDGGAVGCHDDSRGGVRLHTSDASWDAGQSVRLLGMTLDSFVDASGTEIGSYNLYEWYPFEVTYTRDGGVVSLEYALDGSPAGSVTRSATSFEDDLEYLSLKSGDFAVAWDSLSVETDDSGGSGVDLRSIGCGETLTGEIDESDPDGDRGNYEPVTFDGLAGRDVTVEMSSGAGDTYLKLYDPAGSLVAENDDGGSGLNSALTRTLQQTGTYSIHATSFSDDATFPYELSLSCTEGPSGGVTIQTIDPDEFPLICAYLRVDTPTGRGGDILPEDVQIFENGDSRSVADFQHLGDDGGTVSSVDVSFVFDDTGSMAEEIADMKAQVSNFANTLEAEGFDARYSLVSFKDDVEVDQSFTSDIGTFQSAVDGLTASEGNDTPEDNFDALEAALNLNYRPDAEQVIIDITDSVAHYDGDGSGYTDWTMSEMTSQLLSAGVTYVAVAPSVSEAGTDQSSKQVLAQNVGGRWIDIGSADFSEILEDIGAVLTEGRYLVCFSSPLPCNDTQRTVEFVVDDPQGQFGASSTYLPPADCDNLDLRSISCGETLTGEIDESDPDGDRGNYEPVTVDATAGQEITVEMTAPSSNTYLKLYTPVGSLAAEDNDSGSGVNSTLTHELQYTGTYTIHATSYFEDSYFTYDLSLSCTTDSGEIFIQTVDPDEFPLVCTYLRVDTPTGRGGDILPEDIQIFENGDSRSVADFQHLGDDGGAVSSIDISFVFDDTGSMAEEIADMKAQVSNFANTLEAEGFDARYSLVSFKDDVEVDQSFTSDIGTFQSAVDGLTASEGDDTPEDNFDALEAALNLNYRSGAEQVIIDITDSVAHYDGDGSGYTDWTMSEMTSQLLSAGVTYVAVAPSVSEAGTDQSSKQVLAQNVGGRWINIDSADFSEILEDIGGVLTEGRYLVCFSSPLPCNDTQRTVEFVVDDPLGEIQASSTYIPPFRCWGDEEVTACLETGEIPVGDTADICVTLDDFDNGLAGCELELTLPDIVTPVSATVNSAFGIAETDVSGQTVTLTASDTNNNLDEPLDSVQVGCITVEGVTEGTGTVSLDPIQVDDDDGFPIGSVVFSSDCRGLAVLPAEDCPTVDGTQTADLDGDGLCEDLNGNGRLDFDDVNTFFDNVSDPDVTENVEAFDFNGNGRIDFDDINTLFEEL